MNYAMQPSLRWPTSISPQSSICPIDKKRGNFPFILLRYPIVIIQNPLYIMILLDLIDFDKTMSKSIKKSVLMRGKSFNFQSAAPSVASSILGSYMKLGPLAIGKYRAEWNQLTQARTNRMRGPSFIFLSYLPPLDPW